MTSNYLNQCCIIVNWTTSVKLLPNWISSFNKMNLKMLFGKCHPFCYGLNVITLTSWWPRWRPKSPASRLFTQSFIQAHIKENINALRHWPLCGEFTGTGEFPAQRASNTDFFFIWWRHHVLQENWVPMHHHSTHPVTKFQHDFLASIGHPLEWLKIQDGYQILAQKIVHASISTSMQFLMLV